MRCQPHYQLRNAEPPQFYEQRGISKREDQLTRQDRHSQVRQGKEISQTLPVLLAMPPGLLLMPVSLMRSQHQTALDFGTAADFDDLHLDFCDHLRP